MRLRLKHRLAHDQDGGVGRPWSVRARALFLLLVFGVIEFGLLLHSYITMQHAVDGAARYAVTGEGYDATAGPGVREEEIVAVARAASDSLMINDGAFGDQAGVLSRQHMRSSGSGSGIDDPNNAGRANEFVRVVIEFNHPALYLDHKARTLSSPDYRGAGDQRALRPRGSWACCRRRLCRPTRLAGRCTRW